MTLVVRVAGPAETLAVLRAIEADLAGAGGGVAHEVIAVYSDATHDAVDAIDVMADRPATLRLVRDERGVALAAAAALATGDAVVVVDKFVLRHLPVVVKMAAALRGAHAALLIATTPRGRGRAAVLDWLLAGLARMGDVGLWNPLTGMRVYAAEFLDGQTITAADDDGTTLELAVKAQLEHLIVGTYWVEGPGEFVEGAGPRLGGKWLREALVAPVIVWGVWAVLVMVGLIAVVVGGMTRPLAVGYVANVALPAMAVFAFTLAVRRVRGRVRIADAFFSLVLLNPLFDARGGRPFDATLLAAGLLGLMAGAVIAMKSDHLRRYVAVAALALVLVGVSPAFAILLPPIVVWLVMTGYKMALSGNVKDRMRGYMVLGAAEADLMVFCLAAFLSEPGGAGGATTVSAGGPSTVFASIVTVAGFPLLVLSIVMLALGWRTGPGGKLPPYFAGMLALLVGMLTMLVMNFSGAGGLGPASGTDQTAVILCLLYTVFALHGPRRLQWLVPPLLLAGAVAYSAFRP